ncbi:MAG: nuclear transport factor 2 family protein [Terriglobia bacterium]
MRVRFFPAVTVLLAAFVLLSPASAQEQSRAEEIPLGKCGRLPIVAVSVNGEQMRFLVDTAATSMLNLRSFSGGKAKDLRVTSWSGTRSTGAREIGLQELTLGRHRLRHLKLPAIDLSPIEKACGGTVDGILGVDLLERMDVTIDFKSRVARLGAVAAPTGDRAGLQEYRSHQQGCIDALNRGDILLLEDCFEPSVVLFTPAGEFHGRRAVVDYLRRRYLERDPPARFSFRDRDIRFLGDFAWAAYNYSITYPDGVVQARGTGLCRKIDGQWRMMSMHTSVLGSERSAHP